MPPNDAWIGTGSSPEDGEVWAHSVQIISGTIAAPAPNAIADFPPPLDTMVVGGSVANAVAYGPDVAGTNGNIGTILGAILVSNNDLATASAVAAGSDLFASMFIDGPNATADFPLPFAVVQVPVHPVAQPLDIFWMYENVGFAPLIPTSDDAFWQYENVGFAKYPTGLWSGWGVPINSDNTLQDDWYWQYENVIVPPPLYGFSDDFNRSNRALIGDNGWVASPTGSSGLQIVSNRLQFPGGAGFPGSSGSLGVGAAHNVPIGSTDVEDMTFDIITGAITTPTLNVVLAGTMSGAIDSGALLRLTLNTPNFWIIQKITSTNSVIDHTPATSPTIPANVTTTMRVQLTRSTGVLKIWMNGSLSFTSTAGHFSGLTGGYVHFGASASYASQPVEVDNVVVTAS